MKRLNLVLALIFASVLGLVSDQVIAAPRTQSSAPKSMGDQLSENVKVIMDALRRYRPIYQAPTTLTSEEALQMVIGELKAAHLPELSQLNITSIALVPDNEYYIYDFTYSRGGPPCHIRGGIEKKTDDKGRSGASILKPICAVE